MFDNLSYTGKDIQSIREEIIEFIKRGNPDWTDFNESSLQMQFTEIVAGVADMLCYYLDNQALETFLMTARQTKNINAILTTIGYKIERMGTARGEVTFSREAHEFGMRGPDGSYEEGRFLIPKYTVIASADRTVSKYLTMEEVSMSSVDMSINVPVVQGKVCEARVPISVVRSSYKIYLTERPVPMEFVEILDEGWEKVEDAYIEIRGGKKYSVHTDAKDMVYVLFTYDWTKYLTSEDGAVMRFRYLESDGEKGRCAAYQLNRIESSIIDLDTNSPVMGKLSVINEQPTYGAFDKMDINRQKANARNYLKTYDRIILLEDLDTLLRKETWIKDCVCFDWRKNDTIVPFPHQVKAWVVTVDGVNYQGEQIEELTRRMQSLTVCMTQIQVKPAEFIDWSARVGIFLSSENETFCEQVRQNVENKLKDMYTMESYLSDNKSSVLKFGLEIRPAAFESEIRQVSSSIREVKLGFDNLVALTETQFLNCTSIEVYLYKEEIVI